MAARNTAHADPPSIQLLGREILALEALGLRERVRQAHLQPPMQPALDTHLHRVVVQDVVVGGQVPIVPIPG